MSSAVTAVTADCSNGGRMQWVQHAMDPPCTQPRTLPARAQMRQPEALDSAPGKLVSVAVKALNRPGNSGGGAQFWFANHFRLHPAGNEILAASLAIFQIFLFRCNGLRHSSQYNVPSVLGWNVLIRFSFNKRTTQDTSMPLPAANSSNVCVSAPLKPRVPPGPPSEP